MSGVRVTNGSTSDAANDYSQTNFPYMGIVPTEKFKTELFPHQAETVEWMLYRESIPYENVRGGLVASQMGLGKTLSSLACVVLAGGSTLMIVPAQLVYVWEGEIQRHFTDLSYFVYHGPMRKKKFEKYRLEKGDPLIIIMSYQSVVGDIDDEGGPLQNMDFYRIIFDECHYIKNHNTEVFKAVSRIRSQVKWFLSGTPIMNKIHEMYPYLKLLNYAKIRSIPQMLQRGRNGYVINNGYYGYGNSPEEVTRNQYVQMQQLLKNICIRRTKDILNLPKKDYIDSYVRMNGVEWEFYDTLKTYCRIRVKKLMRNIRKVNQSMLLPAEQNRMRVIILQSMLSLIFHLRLACCDPLLVIDKIPRTRDLSVAKATEELKGRNEGNGGNDEGMERKFADCTTCYNNEATVRNKKCGHMGCRDCWKKLSKMEPMRCFTCFEETDVIDLEEMETEIIKDTKSSHDDRILHRSSKTRAVLDIIKRELGKGKKVCVVSQWTTYLDRLIMQFKCENRDVTYVKLDGKTAPIKRQKMVNEFQEKEEMRVCFASLGSSAEGITLHSACTMVICDVYWNKAKISQVSDRIHRIGQKRDVIVYCMYVEDSIEMKMKELVDRKDAICKVVVDCMAVTRYNESFLARVVKLME